MLLGVLVYLGALDNPFVYDDQINVVQKVAIRDLSRLGLVLTYDRFRPLVNLSYAVDHALWGLSPRGYHLTNLLLHALNVALLFVLAGLLLADRQAAAGRTAGPDRPSRGPDSPSCGLAASAGGRQTVWAWAVAALFAVHPLMTEAVGYVSGRAEILCATFFLLALLALRTALVSGRRRWLLFGLLAWALALGTKEHAAMLPLLLLAYDRLLLAPADDRARRRLLRLHLPLLALLVAGGAARAVALLQVEYEALPRPVLQNLQLQALVIWRYLMLLVAPLSLSLVHQVRPVARFVDPVCLTAGLGLVLLLLGALRLRRRMPCVCLGLVWFLALLAPSSSLIPLLEPMAEHRVYLASIGFFVAACALLWSIGAWLRARIALLRPLLPALLLLLIAALATLTVLRNRVWARATTLWQDAARKAPGVWAPHYALGDALRAEGRCSEAAAAYRRAIALLPEEPRAHNNLGICLARLGRDREAWQAFQAALSAAPGNAQTRAQAHNNLGTLATRHGDWIRARQHFEQALQLAPDSVVSLLGLGLVAERTGRWIQAARYLQRARQIDGRNFLALARLAALLGQHLGRAGEARQLCQELIALAPAWPGAAWCADLLGQNPRPGAKP